MKHFNFSHLMIVVFCLLFVRPVVGQTSDLTGEYIHVPNSKKIFLEKIHHGILFKSNPNQQWIFFEKKGRSVYFDKKGNRIETISDNEIVLVKRNSRRGLHFHKTTGQRPGFHSPEPDHKITRRPEGLWFDEKTDTYLIVVETREGIKVRLKDSRIWHEYRSNTRNGVYESFDGNKYVWNDLEMQYFHNENQYTLKFYKNADDFDGY